MPVRKSVELEMAGVVDELATGLGEELDGEDVGAGVVGV